MLVAVGGARKQGSTTRLKEKKRTERLEGCPAILRIQHQPLGFSRAISTLDIIMSIRHAFGAREVGGIIRPLWVVWVLFNDQVSWWAESKGIKSRRGRAPYISNARTMHVNGDSWQWKREVKRTSASNLTGCIGRESRRSYGWSGLERAFRHVNERSWNLELVN